MKCRSGTGTAPFKSHSASKYDRFASHMAAACLSIATLLPLGMQAARADDTAGALQASEESVLVAIRDTSSSDVSTQTEYTEESDDASLEPVAQSSDVMPELAAANDEDAQGNKLKHSPRQASKRNSHRR